MRALLRLAWGWRLHLLLTDASIALLQAIFNQLDHESRCAETIKVLVDLELLARADFSVMSYTSGWAHLVESLRGSIRNKMRWTFVDASAIRNDVWDRLRRHFNAAWQ